MNIRIDCVPSDCLNHMRIWRDWVGDQEFLRCVAESIVAKGDRAAATESAAAWMSSSDVPAATIRAVLRCQPVKVIDRPVDIEGAPYGDDSKEPDWQWRGKILPCLSRIDGCMAYTKDHVPVWLWNLEPAV